MERKALRREQSFENVRFGIAEDGVRLYIMTPLICVVGVKHYAFSDWFKCVLIDFQVSSHGLGCEPSA